MGVFIVRKGSDPFPRPRSLVSREERREVGNNTLHHFDQALKRRQDKVSQRVGFEDYSERWIEFHIHYSIRRRDGDRRQHCVVFQRRSVEFGMDVGGGVITSAFESQLAALGHRNKWHQEPVLVGYVALVDEQKGVLVGACALIRLHPLDHCRHVFAKPILKFCFAAVESAWVFDDRKVGCRCVLDAARRVPAQYQPPEQMIESAPHIVDTVANEKRPPHQRETSIELEAQNMHPWFGIQLFSNRIGFSIEKEGIDGYPECVKVLARSLDLRATAI